MDAKDFLKRPIITRKSLFFIRRRIEAAYGCSIEYADKPRSNDMEAQARRMFYALCLRNTAESVSAINDQIGAGSARGFHIMRSVSALAAIPAFYTDVAKYEKAFGLSDQLPLEVAIIQKEKAEKKRNKYKELLAYIAENSDIEFLERYDEIRSIL